MLLRETWKLDSNYVKCLSMQNLISYPLDVLNVSELMETRSNKYLGEHIIESSHGENYTDRD